MTLLCIGSAAVADEVTVNLNSSTGFENKSDCYLAAKDGFTFSYTGNSSGLPAPSSSYIQVYKGGVLSIKGTQNQTITKVVMTATSTKYAGFNTVSTGTGSWSSTTYTWTGSSNEIAFTADGSQARISKAVITYTPGEEDAVAAPTFVVESIDEYSSLVEISCATEGASIYYTLDGNDPTDASKLYDDSEMIEVYTGITTIKAIAYKDGKHSKVAEKVVEIPYILDGFSALSDFPADQDMKVIFKDAVFTIVYQNGANLYVKDAYGNYMLFYNYNQPAYSNGDTFNSATGTYTVYNGQPEITSFTLGEVTTGGEAVDPTVTTIGMIGGFTMNQYFAIENVAITGVNDKTATMTDADGNSVALYNKFSVDGFANTEKNVTVTGFVAKNKDNIQFLPILIEEYVDPYSAPIFTPADGTEVANGQFITITAGEDAEIYWRSDAFNMAEDEWELYADGEVMIPFNATGNVTFEAYAKYGDVETEKVSATYKIGKGDVNAHFYDFATWEPITEYTMTFGDEVGFAFEANYMEEFDVTSSDENVARFNWEFWGFEIVGPGTATLTVTIPESQSYQAGTATLELTVIDPNAPEYYEAWEAVTSIDQLKDGDTVTFMAKEYVGKATYPEVAMKEVTSSDVISVTEIVDGQIPEDALEMTLNITDGGKYTIYSEKYSGYLNATAKNKVNFTESSKELTISINADGSATVGGVTISNVTYTLQYNPNVSGTTVNLSTARFAFYSSSQQKVYLYHKVQKVKAPEGAHNFAAEEIEDGETSVLVVKGVHAQSELYYRFTPDQQTEIVTYAESHEGFTKSEVFEAAEDNTNTHRIAVSAPGTYELYTYHAASATKSEIAEVKVKATTGINGIEIDNEGSDVEYYNLQGIRVDNPANGLYIRRQGNTTTKVIL